MDKKEHIKNLVRHYKVNWEKDKDQSWAELMGKVDMPGPKRANFVFRKWAIAVASVIAVLLLFSILADSFLFTKKYLTNSNVQQSIWLPDSSFVLLNPNSKLNVNYSFITGKRSLKLNGEALFTVQKGKRFTVKFTGGEVRVLGTRFTINAFQNQFPEIYCLSGRVEVKSEKDNIILTDENGAVIKENQIVESVLKPKEKVLDEFNGEFFWENISLKKVFAIIKNRFGYEIMAQSTIENRKFSGSLNMNNLKSVCEVISTAMDLHYSIDEKNKTVIFEDSK